MSSGIQTTTQGSDYGGGKNGTVSIFNGKEFTASSVAPGVCKDGGATCGNVAATVSPPAPDNGTAGVAATATAVSNFYSSITSTSSSMSISHYNHATINNSTNYGPTTPDDPDEPTDPGEEEPCTGDDCSTVKIDEAGTPSEFTDQIEFDQDTSKDEVIAQAQTNPASGVNWSGLFPTFGSQACQSIELDVIGRGIMTIPGVQGCTFLDKFKLLLAWALFIGVAFVCVQRTMEEI